MPAALPISLFISGFPNPSETFIQAQVEGLIERGASVEVVALRIGDANVLGALLAKWPDKLKVRLASLPKTFFGRVAAAAGALGKPGAMAALDTERFGDDASSLRLLIATSRWPKEAKPERRVWLAHYGRWGRFVCALRDLGLVNGPVATVFHGRDMSAFLKKKGLHAYERLFMQGDLFLPVSEFWREKLLAMHAPQSRTMVHRMGVDTTRFREHARALAPNGPVRFIGVGRMVEKKGFADAISAFAAMRAAPDAPEAILTLVGEGDLRPKLAAQAAALGVGDAVRFTGLLSHARVAEAMAQAHVFVLPSRTAGSGDMEGIPVALMEAMAHGLPVLATRHSGTPELVEHGVSGLICDEGDRAALAENMSRIARMPECWAAMGSAGAAKVRAEFDLNFWNDRLFERLSSLYSQGQ